jgi:hypothetical protein
VDTLFLIYKVGIVAAFVAGWICLFLLLVLHGLAPDGRLSDVRPVSLLLHIIPSFIGSAVLALVGALVWPLSMWLYLYEAVEIVRRLRKAFVEAEDQRRKEEGWPLFIQKEPDPVKGITFSSGEGGERPPCPVCMEAMTGDVKVCPRCGTAHHAECWEYQGGCGMFGCKKE